MRILLFNNPINVTEEELKKDFYKLPQWRKEKVNSYRYLIDKVLCTKGFLLLKEGLKIEYGIVDEFDFVYNSNEKPSIKQFPEIYFNISHCKKGVICVINNLPVGCDIEEIPEELDFEIYNYIFNKKENEKILKSKNPCIEFTKLWTKKEALIKLQGKQISDDMKSLLQNENLKQVKFKTVICKKRGYVYSICENIK